MELTAGGSSQSDTLYVGKDTGSKGAVSISGKGSNVKTNCGHIGVLGGGSLNLMDGGSMTLTKLYIGSLEGGTGTVTVSGKESLLDVETGDTFLGYVGTGTMEISEEGLLRTSGNFYVGNSEISNGTVMVSGLGSRLETGDTFIGRYGNGKMNITSGGQVDAEDVHIGGGASSNGIVTVSGQSSLFESEFLTVGLMGNGKLVIENGGQMNAGTFQVGYDPHSKGSVMVSEVDSRLETETMYIGSDGNGTMDITSGGQVRAKQVYVGYGTHSNGRITVSGIVRYGDGGVGPNTQSGLSELSALFEPEVLTVGFMGDGELVIENGGQMNTGSFHVGSSTGSKGSVTVSGQGSLVQTTSACVGVAGIGTLDITSGGRMNAREFNTGMETGATSTVTVSDPGSVLETEKTMIGYYGEGELNIADGARMRSHEAVYAGYLSGANGRISVSGEGSRLESGAVQIGYNSRGTLDITNGGRMKAKAFNTSLETGATSTVTVSGPGSVLETERAMIGYYGEGELNIADGAKMRSREAVYAGYLPGANGRISVSGKGSRLESGAAGIGYYSRGTLDITNGGTTHLTGLQVGRLPGAIGVVTVSGEGSRLESGDICIANQGEGTLNITDGGQVHSRLFVYGQYPDSSGSVTVSGPGSRLDAETAWINFGFDRKLDIRDGGHMSSGTLEIRRSAITVSGQDSLLSSRQVGLGIDASDATISVTDGGEIRFEESFEIGGNGALKVSDGGRFFMAPGGFFNIAGSGASASFDRPASFDGHVHVAGTLSAPTLFFSPSSRVTGSQGVIRGDVTLHGSLSPGGANDPFSTPGTLVIDGSYTHEKDSRYVAGIDLDNQVSDRIEVTGDTLLKGGTIEAAWTGHVTGEERFTVLSSANIEGEFDTLAGDTALVKVIVEKTPESVDIVLTRRTGYAQVTDPDKDPDISDNRKLSNALDDLSPKAGKDMSQVLAALDRMTDSDQILSAYDQMTPSVAAGALAVNLDTLRQIGDLTGRHAAALRSERSLASEGPLYIHPFGSVSYRGGDHNDPEYRAGTAGILTGIETRSGSFFTGARGIYASSNIAWKDPGQSSSRTDMFSLGFYGGYLADTWDLYASVDTGGLFYDTRRRMLFGGINRTANASPDGRLFAAQLGGSLDVDLGRSLLRPWASLRYARLTRSDYTEKGAGDLNLTVGDTEVDSLRSTLGLTLTAPGVTVGKTGGRSGNGVNITPELTAAWYHEFMGQNRFDMVSSLAGGGRPFASTQAIGDADLFGFGCGLDLDITATVSGYLRYEGILGDISMNHNLYASITVRF